MPSMTCGACQQVKKVVLGWLSAGQRVAPLLALLTLRVISMGSTKAMSRP
jgi:hypothetical protein